MDEIDRIKQFLIENNIVDRSEFVGCSKREIDEIAASQGFDALPACYHKFLEVMGRNAGQFLRGLTYSYPHIINARIRDGLNEQLLFYGCNSLRRDAFVFRSDQGAQYYFFVCDDDNPFIRYQWEGNNKFPELDSIQLIISPFRFTEFINGTALSLWDIKKEKSSKQ